jgi:hypothetical protein
LDWPQLPPHTESFSFSHLAGPDIDVVNVVIKVKDHNGDTIHNSGNLGHVDPGDLLPHTPQDDVLGQLVTFYVTTNAGNVTYATEMQPANTHICYADCVLRFNEDELIPYGVYVLSTGDTLTFKCDH